jgi:S-formylglutathione hydrolase FrmB
MLGGWLPPSVELLSAVVLAAAIGIRSRRWWVRWMPIVVAVGVATVLLARWYIASEGLAGDPAPVMFWAWAGLSGAAFAVLAFGWASAQWWRRIAAVLSVALSLLCVVLMVNIWVGYVRTVQGAWNFVTVGPLPNQVDMSTVKAMAGNGVVPHKGRIVPVTISADASNFKHRGELVYLPPVWFSSVPPPPLPVVMMIGGEFGTSADWLRAAGALDTLDQFAAAHGGNAPVAVFVDKGGTFSKDTECVNGTRGNAADHLTKDVVPYMLSTFEVSADPANWGVAGWSMGGTCAIDLTVMHPELFSTFIDIAGDIGPNVGTKEQTIDRLFGGDEDAWASFDPTTVMMKHGPYNGVSGIFAVEAPVGGEEPDEHTAAAYSLAETAATNGIECSIFEIAGKHDWPAGASAFQQTLPWLASQLGTPGVPPTPLPGAPQALPLEFAQRDVGPVAGQAAGAGLTR